MEPELECVEVETVRRGYDDFAVDDRSRRKPLEECVVQLGEITVERPQIAALDIDVSVGTECDSPEAVPLGLEDEAIAGRQCLGQLGEHGFDRGNNHVVNSLVSLPEA